MDVSTEFDLSAALAHAQLPASLPTRSGLESRTKELLVAYVTALLGVALGVSAGMFAASRSMPFPDAVAAESDQAPSALTEQADALIARAQSKTDVIPTVPVADINLAISISRPINVKVFSRQSSASGSLNETSNKRFGAPDSGSRGLIATSPASQNEHMNDSISAPPQEVRAFAVSGDLKVMNVDTDSNEIETSDGRVFSFEAGSVPNVTGWQDQQLAVFYTCDHDGSCVLGRPGEMPVTARRL